MKSKAICILGMHRSGTSTITRGINLLGAYLGENNELLPPTPDNPEGYWERKDIYALQDRLLAQLKRRWDTAAPLPDQWHLNDIISPYKEELYELINTHFARQALWAWKDPRTCILLPLWRRALDELGVELHCLFVVRNPLDVANSLGKRDHIPLAKSFGIWFNYNIAALLAAADLPTVFLSYDTFLTGWEPALHRCADALDIPWPADEGALQDAMTSFVRPDLRHSHSTANDLLTAPDPVRELYLALLEQTDRATPITDAFTALTANLAREFRAYASFFQDDADNHFDTNAKLLDTSEQLRQTRQILTGKDQLLADRDRRVSECENQMRAILSSKSWMLTAPFRWIRSKTLP